MTNNMLVALKLVETFPINAECFLVYVKITEPRYDTQGPLDSLRHQEKVVEKERKQKQLHKFTFIATIFFTFYIRIHLPYCS